MSIIEQAARIIDPGLFEEVIISPEPDNVYKARMAYRRSKVLCQASEILKLAAKHPTLTQELIEIELQGWRDLGIPVDNPDLHQAIEQKYAQES